MPKIDPNDFDTASNRDADPWAGSSAKAGGTLDDMPSEMDDKQWLQIAAQNKSVADSYLDPLRSVWADGYNAYRNQHSAKSTYQSARWRGRSKIHRPKMRSFVRKSAAALANALFASSDVIGVEAQNPLSPESMASAAVNKSLLEYRLDRKNGKSGVPWFQTVVGAHNDAIITGLCVSKQFWEYRSVETGKTKKVPLPGPNGKPLTVGGKPLMVDQKEVKIVRDRPMVQLFPPELVLRDPGADWLDQAQESSFIGLMYPMTIGDAEAMIRDSQSKTTHTKWRKLDRAALTAARLQIDSAGVRNAREGTTSDRIDQSNSAQQEFHRIWLIEWFIRWRGEEWHYWTAGISQMLSDPVPLEQAYPAFGGERPIVIGVTSIEPHKADPMSQVASLLPLQDEINALVNLRIDGVKETLRPLAMVKKGSLIDISAIQNRSGDSAVYVTNPREDVQFDRPSNIGQEAYMEMAQLNVDFDDVAGQFNGGTVQTNRQLNETVGGMKMLNASANTVADFDTRCFIETWVEPVLRQLVRLEQYYEDDVVILALAGEKAELYKRYGVDKITNDLLDRELSVTVSAGIGTADPTAKLGKFQQALAVAVGALGPELAMRMKQDAVFDEVFGNAGYRDATARFLHPGDNEDPRIKKMKEAMDQAMAEVEDQTAERENKLEQKRIDVAGEIVNTIISNEQQMLAGQQAAQQQQAGQDQQNQHESDMASQEQEHDMAKADMSETNKLVSAASKGGDQMATNQNGFANAILTQLLGQGNMPPQGPGGGGGGPQPGMPAQPDPMAAVAPVLQQMQEQNAQNMTVMMQMMQRMTQALGNLAEGMKMIAEAQTAPKRIVAGPDGTPVGVVSLPPMSGPPQPSMPMPPSQPPMMNGSGMMQ